MSFSLIFTAHYERIEKRFLQRHPEMLRSYNKTLQLISANPFHPSLRLHSLKGRLLGLHSVSINLSYRITIEFIIEKQQIIPINVGDHDTVY